MAPRWHHRDNVIITLLNHSSKHLLFGWTWETFKSHPTNIFAIFHPKVMICQLYPCLVMCFWKKNHYKRWNFKGHMDFKRLKWNNNWPSKFRIYIIEKIHMHHPFQYLNWNCIIFLKKNWYFFLTLLEFTFFLMLLWWKHCYNFKSPLWGSLFIKVTHLFLDDSFWSLL